MAKSVLDILIKLSKQGNADKETITGLVKLKSSFLDAAAVAGSLVAAGYAVKKVFDATVGTMVEYADQVRTTSRATQLGAEESSRLIQMTDDLGVSYEGLEKAIKSSSDTTDFSIAGLMKTSEEYLKITDAQERAKFAQKQYGKAWIEMVGVLEKGPDAIRAASDAIADNLILTDDAVKQARQYEIALDNVNDSWTGLTVTAGTKGLPMLNTILLAVQKNIDAGLSWRDVIAPVALFDTIKSLAQAHKELNPVIDSGTQSYTAWAKALENTTTSTDVLSVALEEIVVDYSDILGMTGKISDAQMSFGDKVTEVNNDITLSEDERIAKLLDLQTQYDQTTTRIISDNLLQKLSIDGLTQTEFEKAIAFQEATGLITPLAATQAIAFNQITDAAAAGQISVEGLRNAMALLQNKSVTLSVTQITRMVRLDDISNWADKRQGFASGTDGWKTVPGGYPNDSFPIGLTSGEKFAVIPANGGGAGSGGVGGGSAPINVTVNMNSVVSMADRESMKRLTPFIIDGIREAQAQGYIK